MANPIRVKPLDAAGMFVDRWWQFFSFVGDTTSAIRLSGTTAQRPKAPKWIGQPYYDQTLGKPIFVHSLRPVVWHDATGATV